MKTTLGESQISLVVDGGRWWSLVVMGNHTGDRCDGEMD